MFSAATLILAYIALIWAVFVFLVQIIGTSRLFRNFSSPPRSPVSPTLSRDHVPHVTIIRPVKGLEPELYECIASTFRQDYPVDKLSIYLCVADTQDPAYPVLTKIVKDFPQFDARVFVETDDPLLHGADGHINNLGPNPKIRNISRAYREAKGDIIWVIDCNVWIPRPTTGHMIDKLIGLGPDGQIVKPYKFVHQIPLVVDITPELSGQDTIDAQGLLSSASEGDASSSSPAPAKPVLREDKSLIQRLLRHGGGRLDEMFMSTTHAKFYSAINTVGIAPCIVGKSNMFRKSHLDTLTDPTKNPNLPQDRDHPTGIDYFSSYICEDHLIGDLLWRSKLPGFANHGFVLGDFAIQPMDRMSVAAYAARRVRWLRARKWTVLAATLVEPGVESLLCCFYFSFALTTIPWFSINCGIPATWSAMFIAWIAGVSVWMIVDRFLFRRLHTGGTINIDQDTPFFARGTSNPGGVPKRNFLEWIAAWIGREALALPIWTWAVLLGTTVSWRGNTFRVRMDMSVVEANPLRSSARSRTPRTLTPEIELGQSRRGKNRVD
ncbi:hypothetical protein jhhlp_005842 [Lomentospora prolificans]|uniref:Ceramide glucosyltransferase n=1 Tax=Lomentospora prolificans TaxID=41688 RepID=A0A2N3N477_9PEZI|nr:hypothetical protein jhhlp_005842 [Lomentospora prolificans]